MKTLVITALIALSLIPLNRAHADSDLYRVTTSSGGPVVHFTRLHHRVLDVDDHQAVSIFADGLVRVHTPVYMKNPGTFEYRLSAKEMQAFLATLDAKGLMSTDWTATRAARDSAAASRAAAGEYFYVADLTATHITLNFESFGKTGSKGEKIDQKIVWNDVPVDAQRFTSVKEIQQLADVEKTLLALTDHSKRNAVRVAGGK